MRQIAVPELYGSPLESQSVEWLASEVRLQRMHTERANAEVIDHMKSDACIRTAVQSLGFALMECGRLTKDQTAQVARALAFADESAIRALALEFR